MRASKVEGVWGQAVLTKNGPKSFCLISSQQPRASKHGWSGGEILPKSPPKIFQKSSKVSLKSSQNRRPGVVLGALGASWRVSERLGASWGVLGASWGVLWPSWGRLGASWGRLGSKKVANMAPTWVPRGSQNEEKIDAKIDQKFDASWNRFLGGFWWILGTKIEPSWHQDGIKNRCQL